jgi:hypothetical protein
MGRVALAVLLAWVFLVGDVAPYLAWQESRKPTADPMRLLALNDRHPELWLRRAESLAGEGTGWRLEQYAGAREAAEHAVRLHPAGSSTHRGLAGVEALACRTLFRDVESRARASEHYERAHELARYDPYILLELGAFLIDMDDPSGAARAAERALALEPEAVAPRLLLADALLESEGPGAVPRAGALLQEAREAAERWHARAPENAYARGLLRLEPGLLTRIESKMFLTAAQAATAR